MPSDTRTDLYDRHRATMATVLGLDHLPADWNAGITATLVMLAETADLYLDLPLDDVDEPAPVFAPVVTTDGAAP
jgi:hypothetical protein